MKYSNELIEKIKNAGSVEELEEIFKAAGVEMDAAEAFARMHKIGELSDDELDNVSGGGCFDPPAENYAEEGIVDNEKDVVFRFEPQSHVRFYYPMMVRSGRITYMFAWKRDDGRYEPNYDLLEDETGERFTISQCRMIIS